MHDDVGAPHRRGAEWPAARDASTPETGVERVDVGGRELRHGLRPEGGDQVAVDDRVMRQCSGRRPVGHAALVPALEQVAEAGVGADVLTVTHFRHQAGEGLLCGPLRTFEGLADVAILPAHRVAAGVDDQLEAVGAALTQMTSHGLRPICGLACADSHGCSPVPLSAGTLQNRSWCHD